MKERLKRLRLILNLSQEAFGKRINITRSHISSLENGARNITDRIISDICREFNVNEHWFRTGEGGDSNIFLKMNATEITFNHFGYIMENAIPQKKALLVALVEMAYSIPDENWDYIVEQFQSCLIESKKQKGETY